MTKGIVCYYLAIAQKISVATTIAQVDPFCTFLCSSQRKEFPGVLERQETHSNQILEGCWVEENLLHGPTQELLEHFSHFSMALDSGRIEMGFTWSLQSGASIRVPSILQNNWISCRPDIKFIIGNFYLQQFFDLTITYLRLSVQVSIIELGEWSERRLD